MAEITKEVGQPGQSLDALRAELDTLRRRVAVTDEEVDLLQVEAAKHKRKWYREPSVLVAALALIVSIATFVAGQANLISDRKIQDRSQLSRLIEQLPPALAQSGNPSSLASDSALLIASNAAALIDKLGPEESTASEKIEVAEGLVVGNNLPEAKRLATAAERQATDVLVKHVAERILANIGFRVGDTAGGRRIYRQVISQLQAPQNGSYSHLIRDLNIAVDEDLWASDEFTYANNCLNATEQLRNGNQVLDRYPANVVSAQRTRLSNVTNFIHPYCLGLGS